MAPGVKLQLTDGLAALQSDVYALEYEGRRYDIGDRLGYLEATVEYGLRSEHCKDSFRTYLQELIKTL